MFILLTGSKNIRHESIEHVDGSNPVPGLVASFILNSVPNTWDYS